MIVGVCVDLRRENIVVTGGAGFLGKALQTEFARVGVPAERIQVPRRRDYDLTREGDVARMFEDMQPTVIIHLAAEVGGIGANRENPGRFFYANMAMGLHLIERARTSGVRKFVQVGTVCAYPKVTPVPFKEEDLWNGYPEETNAPYGVAKKALLVMLQAYRRQYGLNGIYLLPANLYGPHDNFDLESSHVIPALIRKCYEAKQRGDQSVEVWGSGDVSREFLYVDDCARGIVLAAQHYEGPGPVNLGTGHEVTIRDLAGRIRELVGYQGELTWDSSRPDGQPKRCLDTSKALELFAFKAETALDEGLRRTIEWMSPRLLESDHGD
ncbi:MAG: GDP-L-fucose synthase [Phycisphaerales bacterium]|nr:GDP-L-fucose synthase [Phycisphaerales bacterium]